MDLGLIKSRLSNGVYRRKAGLQWDVEQILKNASLFNYPKSKIVKTSRLLTESLTYLIEGLVLVLEVASARIMVDAVVRYGSECGGSDEEGNDANTTLREGSHSLQIQER